MTERKYRVSFALTEEEYRELWIYTQHRHVGGSNPAAAFSKEAVFAYMAKYPIPEAKRAALECKYDEGLADAKAAQLSRDSELFGDGEGRQ